MGEGYKIIADKITKDHPDINPDYAQATAYMVHSLTEKQVVDSTYKLSSQLSKIKKVGIKEGLVVGNEYVLNIATNIAQASKAKGGEVNKAVEYASVIQKAIYGRFDPNKLNEKDKKEIESNKELQQVYAQVVSGCEVIKTKNVKQITEWASKITAAIADMVAKQKEGKQQKGEKAQQEDYEEGP